MRWQSLIPVAVIREHNTALRKGFGVAWTDPARECYRVTAIIPLNLIIRYARGIYLYIKYPRHAFYEKRDPAGFERELTSFRMKIQELSNALAAARRDLAIKEKSMRVAKQRWLIERNGMVARSNKLQRVISSLVIQAGGELRVSPALIGDLNRNPVLIDSFIDDLTREHVFRLAGQPTCSDCGVAVDAGEKCESCATNPVDVGLTA